MSPSRENDRLRLLVVARRPFQVDELGLDQRDDVEHVQLIRRVNQVETAVDESDPNVVLIDTGFPEGTGFEAIGQVMALATGAGVVALTRIRRRPTTSRGPLEPALPVLSMSTPNPMSSQTH